MNIAQAGDIVEFRDGLQGRVQKVNQNSVIVDITIMHNYKDLDLEPLTVVNHRNYIIVSKQQ